ncbi:C2 and GRAM domain-containing protein [Vitis vinifera]|uniref:C2 and GRAM domain-containing protein n=1 Tax=Vitis vinifera TaxID=29760 RepID=A0A438KBR9_VITVI|nr:C2 and GRAM domain-containing protein [Vitis vinifera]
MRLYAYVLEGRDLCVEDSYVKLQLGKFKSKTRVLRRSRNPVWNEEFAFRVHDVGGELILSVLHHDDDSGFFNSSNELVGRVRIPVSAVLAKENQTLPPTWFSLERGRSGKFISKEYGKILLTISLHGRSQDTTADHPLYAHSRVKTRDFKEWEGLVESEDIVSSNTSTWKVPEGKQLMKAIASRLEKLLGKNEETSKMDDSSEVSSIPSDYEDCIEEQRPSCCSFEEAIELMQSRNGEQEMPENLQGGILLDQTYIVASKVLNMLLFAPNSQFRQDLAELQRTTNMKEGPWTWKSGALSCLTRVVSYTQAATKLVKAVDALEEQTYIKADGREFAVLVNVDTPDVPYGNSFKVELLYKIMPGPELSSGEESSHLVVSWGLSFSQNTIMRGMIEGGARQGLKESFDQFANLLAQNFKTLGSIDSLDKDQMLATLQTEQQSDWELASEYFGNFTVVSAFFMVIYILVHILLSVRSEQQGLEFSGLDLPDSFGELITCGILVIQLERVYAMILHFVQARFQRGSILIVHLLQEVIMVSKPKIPMWFSPAMGKTRTSSVKLQTHDPQWNEILEFDAMEEPPAVLDVEVFDFDGPFDEAASLGHAEINFLRHTSTELADMWVSLEGKLAQSSQSKNSTFLALFGLPPEEFLINDFTCYLKRKVPLQGRLFLSARIVGFYANLFGHKTKFFFLWEDIEDIQVHPPSLASLGSPSLVIILRKGRGLDARHGAKSQDEEGRLKFYFQSFVSFNVASRTIMALWRTRTLTPEQKAQIADEQQDEDGSSLLLKDPGSVFNVEEAKMSKVYSAELPIDIKSLMEMFDGGNLEHKIMEKSGYLNYKATGLGNWEVTCTQKKSPIGNDNGWILNEVMALHDIPFGDHFRVHFRYQIENFGLAPGKCKCEVHMEILWLKSTVFQQRITRNITEKFTSRLKEIIELVEREALLNCPQDSSP